MHVTVEIQFWSSVTSKHPDIYVRTPTHTPTLSVLICLHTHGSDARARSWFSLTAKAAGVSRQILLKHLNLFRPSLPKLFTKDLVKLVWEPTSGASHLHLFHLACERAGDTFDSAETHFQPQKYSWWQKTDIFCICRWRTRQMMRSLPVRAAIRCLDGKCGG